MRGKRKTFFYCPSLVSHLLWFFCCNWYQRELSVIFSKAPGIQPVSQVSALALGCCTGLHGSLQELEHVKIICSLHFDSKSMHFEVIIGWLFFFSFIFFFSITTSEKRHTDLGGGGSATKQPASPPFVLLLAVAWVSSALWDMLLDCNSL